jgi:hypothetical protein
MKMIIHLSSADDSDCGRPLAPLTSWRAQENFASIQKEYIKTGFNFVIKFIIFLEITLKTLGV